MSARIFSTLARGAAALALLAVVGLNARSADAQYCGFYYGCNANSYGAYYGSSSYPYSYYTGYFGYPSSQYYGYPYYYGNPAFGYTFDPIFGFATPSYNYPNYTSGMTTYSFYGTPYRGYYGFGYTSIYGLPTASMVYPGSMYYTTGREYCFPC